MSDPQPNPAAIKWDSAQRAAIKDIIRMVDIWVISATSRAEDNGVAVPKAGDATPDLEDDDLPDDIRSAWALYFARHEADKMDGLYVAMLEEFCDGNERGAKGHAREIIGKAIWVTGIAKPGENAEALIRFAMGGPPQGGRYYDMIVTCYDEA